MKDSKRTISPFILLLIPAFILFAFSFSNTERAVTVDDNLTTTATPINTTLPQALLSILSVK